MDDGYIDLEMFNVEAALFDNLRLLGFDDKKYQLQLTAGMFSRANYAAGDALFYFIFSKLRPSQYEADFQGLWPNSGKAIAAAFRKICHGFVFDLENAGAIAKSNSSRSALANSQGDRFVRVLWQLSAHTLAMNCAKLPQTPPLTCAMHESVMPGDKVDLLLQKLDRVAEERSKLLNTAAVAVRQQKQWQGLADKIMEEHQALQDRRTSLTRRIKNLEDEAELAKQRNATPLNDRVTDAKAAWDCLMDYAEECATMSSGPVRDVIAGIAHRYGITEDSLTAAADGDLYGSTSALSLPPSSASGGNGAPLMTPGDVAREKKGRDSQRDQAASIDLSEIVHQFASSVQTIKSHLQGLARTAAQENSHLLTPKSNPHIVQIRSVLALHKTHLAAGQKLEAQLREQIPLVEQSANRLLHQIDALEGTTEPTENGSAEPHGEEDKWGVEEEIPLGLVPPTPEVKLANVAQPQQPAFNTPTKSDTALPFLTPVKGIRNVSKTGPENLWPQIFGGDRGDAISVEERIAIMQKDVWKEVEYQTYMTMSPLK